MKTSNKLLLILFLTVMAVYGGIHLALYGKYKRGEILQMKDLIYGKEDQNNWITRRPERTPHYISAEDNINVSIITSDSCTIDYQKDAVSQIYTSFSADGDTIYLKGHHVLGIDPHGLYGNYSNYPWVALHITPGTAVQLKNVLALLRSPARDRDTSRPGANELKAATDIKIINTQLWLGETYDVAKDDPSRPPAFWPSQFYGPLRITAQNSNIILHSNAYIQYLFAGLDDRTERSAITHTAAGTAI